MQCTYFYIFEEGPGGGRFGGPQRFSPYDTRGPMPPGGPWGPYGHPMHHNPYGHYPPPPGHGPPPMRNPEYETFDVSPFFFLMLCQSEDFWFFTCIKF